MAELVRREELDEVPVGLRVGVDVDEAAARRQLREQIARLESELSSLFCSVYPRTGFDWGVGRRARPRLLSLNEPAQLRDLLPTYLRPHRPVLSHRPQVQ